MTIGSGDLVGVALIVEVGDRVGVEVTVGVLVDGLEGVSVVVTVGV